MGHCRYCGHRAGWLRSSHRQCAATYRQGLAQLVDLVVAASGRPDFTQRRMLRILDALAQQCYVPAEYLPAVLAAGWHLSDLNRMVDDVLTQSETARLREFRDGHHPASETPGDRGASLLAAAARAAVATRQRARRIERVSNLLQRSGLSPEESRELLLQAWETAVARQLDDTGIRAIASYRVRHNKRCKVLVSQMSATVYYRLSADASLGYRRNGRSQSSPPAFSSNEIPFPISAGCYSAKLNLDAIALIRALTWTGRPHYCTTPGISTWTMPSWTITGCCASSFRALPSPKRRPVWCPSA